MPTPLTKMAAYLAGLPNGIDSYPACLIKGALARAFLDGAVTPERMREAELPRQVAELLGGGRLSDTWISEVEAWAAVAAVQDLLGFDEAAALAWFENRDREALANPVLRLVMQFSSVEFLLPLGPGYWGLMHKGSRLNLERPGPHEAALEVQYPHGLFDEAVARLQAVALTVPMQLSRANAVKVTLESWTPTRSTYLARWT